MKTLPEIGRFRAALSAACCLVLLLSGCATTTTIEPVNPAEVVAPPLRVGMTPDSPPMAFKEGGKLKGLEVDFAAALGRALKREVTFVEVKWSDQIPALTSRKTDIIMSGMSITSGRAMQVAFTDPYLRVGQLALVRDEDALRFRYPQVVVFSSIPIGVVQGTTGDIFVQRECRKAKRVTFPNAERAVDALKRGKVDMFIYDAPMVWRIGGENESEGLVALHSPLTSEDLAWAVRKDDRDLLIAVNQARDEWIDDGSMEALILRWIPGARP